MQPRSRRIGCVLLVGASLLLSARRAHAHTEHEAEEAAPEQPRYTSRVVGFSPTTATERVVEQKTIAVLPRRAGDDLLRFVPGLLLSQHGAEGKGYQIFLRGFDAAHGADLEVLVEGIPINELSNVHGQGYLDLAFVIPEAVLSLNAAKGSFQTWQGNFATAGTVRLQLGVPIAQRGVRTSYEIGSTHRHRVLALLAPPAADERTFLALEYLRDHGFGENRQAERASLLGQVVLLRRGAHRIEAMTSLYTARFGEPGAIPVADVASGKLGFYGVYSKDTLGQSHRALVQARYDYRRGPTHAELQLYGKWRRVRFDEDFTGFLLDAEHGDERLQRHEAAGAGLIARYERKLHRTLRLVLGGGLDVEGARQSEDQLDEQQRPWRRNRELSFVQLQANVRANLEWHPKTWLHLAAGLRLDVFYFDVHDKVESGRSNASTEAQPSPRVTASFYLPRGVTLFAAYGRGLRAPEARATIKGVSNENVPLSEYRGGPAKLATSDAFEVGMRYRLRSVFELGGAAFGTWIGNESVFDHLAGVSLFLNSTRRLGGELDVIYRPFGWVELRGDFTYVDARFAASGAPVPNAPRGLGSLTATLIGWRGFSAGVRATGLMPRPLSHGATASGYFVLDVRVGYRWRWLGIDLDLGNVTNTKWREGEFHYASWFDRSAARSEIPTRHFSAGAPFTARGTVTLWF